VDCMCFFHVTGVQMCALPILHGLGWLPSFIGFPQPSAEVVRASNGLQTLPVSAQALWSAWLLGTVVLYGLVPRIVALGLSIGIENGRASCKEGWDFLSRCVLL